MRLVIILIALLWGIGGIVAFVHTREKSLDAKLTAAYFLLYPVLVVALFLNEPVQLWIAVPAMFGFIPWFLSGPHLWTILQDPSRSRAEEIIGIPKAYWLWGGLGAILLGVIFN